MKHINDFRVFESLVDKKIQLLKDLSLDLQDDGLTVDVINITGYSSLYGCERCILVDVIDVNGKFNSLHNSDIIKDFTDKLISYGMKPRSISGGDKSVLFKFDKWGSMTNSPLIRESVELDLKDILLELEDLGYRVIHEDDVKGAVTGKPGNIKAIIVRDVIRPSGWVDLTWSELKDYALRIKDYLGDKYLGFMWRSIGGLPITDNKSNPYKTVDLNEDTEIDGRVWSFAIKYKD